MMKKIVFVSTGVVLPVAQAVMDCSTIRRNLEVTEGMYKPVGTTHLEK